MSEAGAELQVRVAVIYYSATGNVRGMARAVAEGAEGEGAEVRLRPVAELSEELRISADQYWGRHRSEVDEGPVAQIEDLEWADGLAFGTPTRFGNVAAQLKVFLDLGPNGRAAKPLPEGCALGGGQLKEKIRVYAVGKAGLVRVVELTSAGMEKHTAPRFARRSVSVVAASTKPAWGQAGMRDCSWRGSKRHSLDDGPTQRWATTAWRSLCPKRKEQA